MSLFSPDTINTSDDVLSAPLRNNFNKLQTLLNGGLTDDQFADNILSGLKLKDATVTAAKTALGGSFLAWDDWTPTPGGFSVNPTINYARWMQLGKLVIITYRDQIDGTSNSTNLTIAGLPVTPLRTQRFPVISARNNGGIINTAIVDVTAASTTLTLYTDHPGTGWANTNGKGAGWFMLFLEVA